MRSEWMIDLTETNLNSLQVELLSFKATSLSANVGSTKLKFCDDRKLIKIAGPSVKKFTAYRSFQIPSFQRQKLENFKPFLHNRVVTRFYLFIYLFIYYLFIDSYNVQGREQ